MPAIGLNGSFAAFRMMHQDVGAFEAFLRAEGERNEVDPELVAAKICGRWRNGDPLMLRLEPEGEIPHGDRNDFDYETTDAWVGGDREGLVCPRGAHIRRAFPRSQRVIDDLTGLHRRIVRRAMPYGPRWREDEPEGIERGLVGYFICASLEHQFEYVMRNWINDGLFTGGRLGRTRDPLVGTTEPANARFHAPGTLEATGFPPVRHHPRLPLRVPPRPRRDRRPGCGVTLRCYSGLVPTRHSRIPVTKDPELAAALERVAPLVPAGVKPATLVHDLAVRGAEAMLAEQRANTTAIERLIARSTADDPGYDRDLLGDIDREAWGLEP